jgi:hypothetical protein
VEGAGDDHAQITFQLGVRPESPGVRYHSDRPNGAYRLVQMTRIGRANEDDGDCWLAEPERQSRRHRRLARFSPARHLRGHIWLK